MVCVQRRLLFIPQFDSLINGYWYN